MDLAQTSREGRCATFHGYDAILDKCHLLAVNVDHAISADN
jgi:hypothetical protein